ncbi:MAG TPA: PepSY domain-containing protein [Thermoleophilaceae bacterium]
MRPHLGKTGAAVAVVAALGLGAAGIALASNGSGSGSGSRLDDGKDLLPQATLSETQAIAAAQTAASGDLNEVDLEHASGRLVFNVDVGSKDVQVDAQSGKVVSVNADD